MKIIGVDTETTGLEQSEGHRIIEIALLTYDFDSEELLDTWVQRINPERAIDPKAQEVHGISYSDLVGCPNWNAVANEVSVRMHKGEVLVAHNMAFDGPFIGMELARVGVEVPDLPTICTMESGRWACADGKSPKLGELCFALGVPYDSALAHGAAYDVQVMMACLFRGLKRGFYTLPIDRELAAA